MFPGKSSRLRVDKSSRLTGIFSATRRLVGSSTLCLLVLLALASCRQKMADQARYDPLEPSDFFEDGMSARPRVPGTVARGEISGNPFFDTGKVNGQLSDGYPMAVTLDVINRGHERYDIYCSQCHGRVGDGNGMIPARGYRRPPSFHTETLRNAPSGHFFDVMTNGFGAMPPYKNQVPPADRWAIAAYIKALQLSQRATIADVPPAERAKLSGAGSGSGAVKAEGGHH